MGRTPKKDLHPDLLKWLHQIGANVAALREESGMTQTELSRRSKVSLTTLNEIETRRFRDIRMSTIIALARGLDVAAILLLRGSDVKLKSSDQTRLMKASEDILRIAKKITGHD